MKSQQEEFTKALLQRIFPEIKVSEKSYDQWLKVFEERVNTVLIDLKKKNVVDTPSELEKQNKNLQDLVSHYKQIIDDTVSFIYSLLKSPIQFQYDRYIYLKYIYRKVCLINFKVT